jgi:drug/metabolite transporter (DMT)-like permease
MNWFFIALVAPIFHAIANHVDKHIISSYFKGVSVGSLVIFSSIFALIILPIIYLVSPDVFSISFLIILALIINGALGLGYVIFYLYALFDEEASIVAPFFQLIPVFGFILGYLFLGEILTSKQAIAALAIVIGAFILSLDINSGLKPKKKLIYLMFSSSLLFALNNVIFKYFAIDTGFSISLFWTMVGQVILGIFLYIFIKSYRVSFKEVIKENSNKVLGLNILNGFIIIVGDLASFYALLFAPVALVFAVSGFQPLFVFIFGLVITLFFPRFGKESLEKRILLQKMVGILIIIVGSIYLN